MKVRSFEINAQLIKDIFHTIMPIALLIILPHGWTTLGIVYVYSMIKFFVYFFIKSDDMSIIAITGLLINAIFLVGYIDAI